ncbi:MAG: nitroreductase family deazaflavin-dependent oxidoreductase [Dermatophilaceae bacterium]|jgi:deazaflavin-dependent oxidoreductase (nitroreductase family)|nr:nitroreductase family deazaflavin-dependent oxidoreductase [Actinomycetales bacterium]MBP8879561.1 nitroreductase family deazaflavin-dependent oxidoreductase [Dermatophilaceae bacterium]MBP9917472.1 nitroreductase family deazaflavin-dependent oxidoreductase [Dermatophilaceae bacterium]
MSDANYLPSASRWVRDQVSAIERAGDTRAVDMGGMRVVLITIRGRVSGRLRKVPLMRVEHDGTYAAIASLGGAPKDPQWAGNLRAHPDVEVQDGRDVTPMLAREVTDPAERAQWWDRAVAAFPDYAAYQQRTTRVIPIFLLEPR